MGRETCQDQVMCKYTTTTTAEASQAETCDPQCPDLPVTRKHLLTTILSYLTRPWMINLSFPLALTTAAMDHAQSVAVIRNAVPIMLGNSCRLMSSNSVLAPIKMLKWMRVQLVILVAQLILMTITSNLAASLEALLLICEHIHSLILVTSWLQRCRVTCRQMVLQKHLMVKTQSHSDFHFHRMMLAQLCLRYLSLRQSMSFQSLSLGYQNNLHSSIW